MIHLSVKQKIISAKNARLSKLIFYLAKKCIIDSICIGLISSLFDVNKNISINYRLCKNERSGLIDQIKYLYEGDILLLDRGYYSKHLLSLLNKNKIDVIFRMKKNNILVKELIEKDKIICIPIFLTIKN